MYLLYNEGRSGHFTFTDSNSIPIVKWETFRAELSFMFADLTDEQHAFMLLRHVEQDKNEKMQTFVEICYLSLNKIVEFLTHRVESLPLHHWVMPLFHEDKNSFCNKNFTGVRADMINDKPLDVDHCTFRRQMCRNTRHNVRSKIKIKVV